MEIKTLAIIEVAGFPKKHVDEVMLKIIENLRKDPDIKLIKEEIAEAQQVKEVFSGFMELEIEFVNFHKLLSFCQNYLPSSIEVVDTKEIKLTPEEFRSGISDLLAHLHRLNILVSNIQAKEQQKISSNTNEHAK